jgi:hypothetical protein
MTRAPECKPLFHLRPILPHFPSPENCAFDRTSVRLTAQGWKEEFGIQKVEGGARLSLQGLALTI